MKIQKSILVKSDPGLAEAFRTARGDDRIRAVLVLSQTQSAGGAKGSSQKSHTLEDRIAARRVLAEQRRRGFGISYKSLTEQLKTLGLQPSGNGTSRVVVVHGAASALAKALALPSIERASLDRPIELIQSVEEPRQRQRVRFTSGEEIGRVLGGAKSAVSSPVNFPKVVCAESVFGDRRLVFRQFELWRPPNGNKEKEESAQTSTG